MKIGLRILAALGFLALVVLGIVWLRQPGLIRAYAIGWSDFEEVSPGIYVSPHTPDAKIDSLLLLVSQARQRNALFWGENKAHPPIIYCHTAQEVKNYAAVPTQRGVTAAFFFTPIFSYVQVGPPGLHSEVLAHELCHPELFVRTGWYHHEFNLPVWFFEGLAMQLDHREGYSERRFQKLVQSEEGLPELSEIGDWPGFFGGEAFVNYTVARHEVGRWLDVVGKDGLFRLIDGLDDMEDFESLYRAIEEEAEAALEAGR
ncbi:MAG: hypothetical protein AAFQ68_25085 [Bacteroidota bacterium]